MTKDAEYKREERKRKRAEGLVPIEAWVYPEHKAIIKTSLIHNYTHDDDFRAECDEFLRGYFGCKK